jgi:hypothetical protein
VIVWINGAFGAGKSTVVAALRELRPDLREFDPEYVGYVLRRFVPVPTGDFQDLRLWRTLTVQFARGLVGMVPATWVVPMTLLDPGYRAEILDGLRLKGIPVRQVVLTVPEDTLRKRIDADTELADAREWRHDHVSRALVELSGLAVREPDTFEVDNDARTPAEVAAEIAELVLPPPVAAPDTL